MLGQWAYYDLYWTGNLHQAKPNLLTPYYLSFIELSILGIFCHFTIQNLITPGLSFHLIKLTEAMNFKPDDIQRGFMACNFIDQEFLKRKEQAWKFYSLKIEDV